MYLLSEANTARWFCMRVLTKSIGYTAEAPATTRNKKETEKVKQNWCLIQINKHKQKERNEQMKKKMNEWMEWKNNK